MRPKHDNCYHRDTLASPSPPQYSLRPLLLIVKSSRSAPPPPVVPPLNRSRSRSPQSVLCAHPHLLASLASSRHSLTPQTGAPTAICPATFNPYINVSLSKLLPAPLYLLIRSEASCEPAPSSSLLHTAAPERERMQAPTPLRLHISRRQLSCPSNSLVLTP